MSGLLAHFSNFGASAKIKLVIVGSTASLIESVKTQLSSLNFEHVSPEHMIRQEISRRTPLGQSAEAHARRGQSLADETMLALMRRWFWTRKPDAGFLLTGFPATLLHAKVFDEWLDARGENLDGVIDASDASAHTASETSSLLHYYKIQGLLVESAALVSQTAA